MENAKRHDESNKKACRRRKKTTDVKDLTDDVRRWAGKRKQKERQWCSMETVSQKKEEGRKRGREKQGRARWTEKVTSRRM